MNYRLTRTSTNAASDDLCCWDASASELGLTAEAPAPSAGGASREPSTDEPSTAQTDTAQSDTATADTAPGADEDPDSLDVLSPESDESDDPAKPALSPDAQRYKKRARTLEKKLKSLAKTDIAMREHGVDLKTLLSSHQELTALRRSIETNPRIAAMLNGEFEPESTRARQPASREPDPPAYPFETETDPNGRWFKEFHTGTTKQLGTLAERLEALERSATARVGRIEQTFHQQQQAAAEHQWRTVFETEAKALDLKGPLRTLFQDAMWNSFQMSLRGQLTKTAQEVADHYLKELRAERQAQRRTTATEAHRTAQRNTELPRRAGLRAGTPASHQSAKLNSLEEFNRDLVRRFSGG